MSKICNICGKRVGEEGDLLVDGQTRLVNQRGRWAFMCIKCFDHSGVGLGTGRGQMYQMTRGRWKKLAG